jgi:hypothetical protein
MFAEMLCRSGRSLRTLHLEHCTGPSRDVLAQIISTHLPEMMKLTVIMPDAQALSKGILELHELLDVAMISPLLSLNELYAAGLSITDTALLRTHNQIGETSACPSCFNKQC